MKNGLSVLVAKYISFPHITKYLITTTLMKQGLVNLQPEVKPTQ